MSDLFAKPVEQITKNDTAKLRFYFLSCKIFALFSIFLYGWWWGYFIDLYAVITNQFIPGRITSSYRLGLYTRFVRVLKAAFLTNPTARLRIPRKLCSQ